MTHRMPSESDVLTSTSNPVIKRIRSLQRRKFRQQERAFVVEGVRAVEDVLAAGIEPLSLILRTDVNVDLPEAVHDQVRFVSESVFDALTDVANPQGILAVVPMLEYPDLPKVEADPFVVILDGVRDPGNMGTLLRSAAGAGVDHVLIGPESVDPYHPKAVRAAMGAHVRVAFSERSYEEIGGYVEPFSIRALADAGGNALYDSVNWHASSALIIGGEAFGASSGMRELANVIVSIPLENGVESLNAGVAGSLLVFEAARQRRSGIATRSRRVW